MTAAQTNMRRPTSRRANAFEHSLFTNLQRVEICLHTILVVILTSATLVSQGEVLLQQWETHCLSRQPNVGTKNPKKPGRELHTQRQHLASILLTKELNIMLHGLTIQGMKHGMSSSVRCTRASVRLSSLAKV